MKTKIYFLQQLNYNHIHHHVCLLQGHSNPLSVQWHVYHSFEWHIIVAVKIRQVLAIFINYNLFLGMVVYMYSMLMNLKWRKNKNWLKQKINRNINNIINHQALTVLEGMSNVNPANHHTHHRLTKEQSTVSHLQLSQSWAVYTMSSSEKCLQGSINSRTWLERTYAV